MRTRIWTTAGTGLALIIGLVSIGGSEAAAAGAFCEAKSGLGAPHVFQPTSGLFGTPANWTGNVAPDNTPASRDTGYFCVPAGKTAIMNPGDGIEAFAQIFDVAGVIKMLSSPPGPVLGGNHKLFAFGDKTTQPSVVRPGGAIINQASTVGGPGRWDVLGTVSWTGFGTGKAATITTRPCTVDDMNPCTTVVGTAGLMVIGNGGTLNVDGTGVNLWDRYTIEVQNGGVVRLVKGTSAYIAADHGTALQLDPGGTFDIQNDGGYLEGRNPAFDPDPALSRFVNKGLLAKSGGSQQSLISALYQPGASGKVRVDAGTLRINTNAPISVGIKPGTTYGTGRCPQDADGASIGNPAAGVNCQAPTDSLDPQNEAFRAPSGKSKPILQVTIFESGTNANAIGQVVTLRTPKLRATKKKPAIISLRYDGTLVAGHGPNNLRVYRQGEDGKPFRRLRDCNAQRRPKAGEVACVDRRASRQVGDDVIMVIRTIGNSKMYVSSTTLPAKCDSRRYRNAHPRKCRK